MNRDFKGIWIPANIWLNKQLSLVEKFLILEIDSLDRDGEGCFAGDEHFAEFLDLSVGRVSNILVELRKRGIIRTIKSDGRKRWMTVAEQFKPKHIVVSQKRDILVHENVNSELTEPTTPSSRKQDTEGINEQYNEELFEQRVQTKKKRRQRCLFENSEFADKQKFIDEFKGTDYENADLTHYFEAVKNWSKAGGKMKQDWIATTRNFMLNDKKHNKLQLNQNVKQQHATGNNTSQLHFLNL